MIKAIALAITLVTATAHHGVHAQTLDELNKPSSLGDMMMGSKTATVTIIEYASLTCPHCANFVTDTLPKIKANYIDAGKVRFIFREFPLDKGALAASAAVRCIAKDNSSKFFALIGAFMSKQEELVKESLVTINLVGKQYGVSEKQIKACVDDDTSTKQKIIDDLKYANGTLKVLAPVLFINGKSVPDKTSFDEIEKIIKPLLKS
jgi:protein-disulfide isomerase